MNLRGEKISAGFLAIFGAMAMIAAVASPVVAQQAPEAKVGYVYPAGGARGQSFLVTVAGQRLNGAKGAIISGDGIKATLIEYVKPPSQAEIEELREKSQELEKKFRASVGSGKAKSQPASRATWTAEDQADALSIIKPLAAFNRNRQVPALGETVSLKIEIAADAAPGQRQLRLVTALGLSNPLPFCIGDMSESAEPVSIGLERMDKIMAFGTKTLLGIDANPAEVAITLPAMLNGQIMPGDVDRYRFAAMKGDCLVVAADARRLMPYMADAVPGWFQARLTVRDPDGNEIVSADHYRFDPDPAMSFVVPRDGVYTLEVADALYRGREDFVYRVAIGKLAFVTSVFPLGGQAGKDTSIELQGWNLPAGKMNVNFAAVGVHAIVAGKNGAAINAPLFSADTLPECLEISPNNSAAGAQPISLPVIVNGRIERKGEWDFYRFKGKSGQKIAVEVNARRLGSPLDSYIMLTDGAGKQLATNDDCRDVNFGLETHHADSRFVATLPADGEYYLRIGDVQNKFGPEYAYRLRVSEASADFDLIVCPSAINARPGQTMVVSAAVVRKDGFDGAVDLSLKGAPDGFALNGARIPAGQNSVRLTLTMPNTPAKEPILLAFEGSADISGKKIVRRATAADDMMQAFAYRHFVSTGDLMTVCLVGQPFGKNSIRMDDRPAVKIALGATASVIVPLPKSVPQGELSLELSDPPEGISIKDVVRNALTTEVVLQCDGEKIKQGVAGNLIFNIILERTAKSDKPDEAAKKRRTNAGVLPAIPFEVVAK